MNKYFVSKCTRDKCLHNKTLCFVMCFLNLQTNTTKRALTSRYWKNIYINKAPVKFSSCHFRICELSTALAEVVVNKRVQKFYN